MEKIWIALSKTCLMKEKRSCEGHWNTRGKPASNQLPKNSGAIIRAYTEEEAEQWIAAYNEATKDIED